MISLPELRQAATSAEGPRYGHPVQLVVVHRWGVRYTDYKHEAAAYDGVVRYFGNPDNEASAHFVYAGSSHPAGEPPCTQMVQYEKAAWTESGYNSWAVEVESADAIWLKADEPGFKQLARIVAYLLHRYNLPARWAHPNHPGDGIKGFCRHADLGQPGGGHLSCPTTDMLEWHRFCQQVAMEAARGQFRSSWGR